MDELSIKMQILCRSSMEPSCCKAMVLTTSSPHFTLGTKSQELNVCMRKLFWDCWEAVLLEDSVPSLCSESKCLFCLKRNILAGIS